ncbi:MAG: hypothetical protein RIB86_07455, partial [Imperialibacter sp.]
MALQRPQKKQKSKRFCFGFESPGLPARPASNRYLLITRRLVKWLKQKNRNVSASVLRIKQYFWGLFFFARVSSHYIKKQKVQAGRIEPVLLLYCLSFANWYNVISESYS